MPLPGNYATVIVTGTYTEGSALGPAVVGSVTFVPTYSALQDLTAATLVMPKAITANLNASGVLSVALPVTDSTSVVPTGFTYTVTESFVGVNNRSPYSIVVPSGSPGGTLDLSKVSPVQSNLGAGFVLFDTSSFAVVVQHGAVATTARPVVARVFWYGTVAPINALQFDRWMNTTVSPYTESIYNGAAWTALGGSGGGAPTGAAGGGLGGTYPNPTVNAIAVPTGLSATGAPSATTFLRGDGSWAAPVGSGAAIGKGVVTGPGAVVGAAFSAATTLPNPVNTYDIYSGLVTTNTIITLFAASLGADALIRAVQNAIGGFTITLVSPGGTISYPAGTLTFLTAPNAVNEFVVSSPDGTNFEVTPVTGVAGSGSPIEQTNVVAASGAAQTIPDVTTATINRIVLTAACTFTFPTLGAGKSFTVELVQDAAGGRTAIWPVTVLWSGGTTPTLTAAANKRDVFTFLSTAGSSWLGFTAGLNF